MTFKEQLQKDAETIFLNQKEFTEIHMLNGKEVPMIIDSNELMERGKRIQSYEEGIYKKQMLIYIKVEDFGALPVVGNILWLDQKQYRITDSVNEDGIYSIHLEVPQH